MPLEDIKNLLKQANINPGSINIISAGKFNALKKEKLKKQAQETDNQIDVTTFINNTMKEVNETKDSAYGASPRVFRNYKNEMIGYTAGELCFDKDALLRLPREKQLYLIAHEISHLIACDRTVRENLYMLETEPQSYDTKIIDLLREEEQQKILAKSNLYHLQEIRADILFLRKDPNFAKQTFKVFEKQFAVPSIAERLTGQKNKLIMKNLFIMSPHEHHPFRQQETHPDFITRWHWMGKMHQIHEQTQAEKDAREKTSE